MSVKWVVPGTETETGETMDMGVKQESLYDIKPHRTFCMYRKGTVVFIQNDPGRHEVGTVQELDVKGGVMLINVPQGKNRATITAYPHSVTPMSQRCYWNFFTRKWIVDQMLPPIYQFIIDNGNGTPRGERYNIS